MSKTDSNTIVVTGKIVNVTTKYDKKKRNVYFSISALGNDLIRTENGTVRCLGSILDVNLGAPVKIVGKFQDDILICKTIELAWTSKEEIVSYLTARCKSMVATKNQELKREGKKSIRNLGQKNIEKLVDVLGEDIINLDDETLRQRILMDERLLGIGEQSIAILLRARTKADPVLKELCEELLNYKVSIDEITKIRENCSKFHINNPLDAIREDPYRVLLASDVELSIIDEYAYDLVADNGKKRFTATSFQRVVGYVVNELHNAANDGHTYLATTDLVAKINARSRRSRFGVDIPTSYISMAFSNKGPSSITLDKDKRIVALSQYYNAEIDVATKLIKLMDSAVPTFKVIDEEIEQVSEKLQLSFGSDQKHAFKILERGGVSILTGGPGTGKTTVINGLVALYKMHLPDVVIKFCAPTGKAAKQLNRSVQSSLNDGDSAVTIHKLLNYNPFGSKSDDIYNQPHDKDNPIDADVIIIDESSMIEITVMNMLLDAIKPGTMVIFVGDENQLPCIGAGNCLHDMIASGAFPVYRLNENFRQKGDGSIIFNAKRINKGLMPIDNNEDFLLSVVSDDKKGYEMLCRLMSALYNTRDPFAVQMIEPSRHGFAGIYEMNRFVREQIVYRGKEDIAPTPMIGDKVMVTHTEEKADQDHYYKKFPECDYDIYINGDIGTIVSITEDSVILWDGYDKICYDPSVLHHIEFAYSYTIHKSQGSEADTVIIYLPESMAHMMTRSLFYTAVTRAKKKVIIVATGNALEMCINNTSDIKRNTRLVEHIQFLMKLKNGN